MEILLGIATALCFITLLASTIVIESPDGSHILLLLSVLLMLGIAIITSNMAHDNGIEEGYKQGQVDALNGEYKYQMNIKQDTTYTKQ